MREGLLVGGKYRMNAKLGAGGMGEVWRARNERTDREFAIKFLRAEGARDPNLLARFFQEARVSGKLRHPSILEIIDVGSAPELDDAPFLVMELLDGVSLDALIAALGRLEPTLAVEIVGTVSRALALAHAGGIVHRDLKPANIFLHRPGTGALVPKILDFGISKIAAANPLDAAPGLTQTGTVLGSPLYMSPEQASSDKMIDARSDVHALGVVLWECLVGKPPFPADTYNNLVIAIVTGARPSLAASMPGVPSSLEAVVSRAFARKREDRFAGARELADALDAELAKLGGPRLDARTSAAELFAAIEAARAARPPSPPPQSAPAPRSTTGGVSVATPASPAAYTLGQSPQPDVARSDVQRADAERAQVESAETLPHAAMARSGDTMQSPQAVSARSERSPATRPATRARMRFLLALGGALPVVALLALALRSSRMSASAPAIAPAAPLEPAAAVAVAPASAAVTAEPTVAPPPASSSSTSSFAAAAPPPSASASASAAAATAVAAAPAATARAATKPAAKAVAPAAAAPAAPARPGAKPAAPAKPVQDDPNKLF